MFCFFNMRRFFCVVLGLCTSCLAISTQDSVQYVPLGSKVMIPCDGYGDRKTAKWLHRKDDKAFAIVARETLGYIFLDEHLSARKKTHRNFSLEISPFTELDKGTYVCQVCTSKEKCTDGKPITLLPQFDTFSTPLRRQFIIEGDRFSFTCPFNLTLKTDWRFQAHGESTAISANRELTNKNILFIPDVQPTNAGKYSYWRETSTGQQQAMCSVALCVLTVRAVKLTDSPQNCTLYCDVDMDTDEGGSAVVGTDTWNISIIGKVKKPKSSLSCRLLSRGVETHTFSPEDATATAQSYAVSSITKDDLYSSRPPVAAIISISAALLVIIITALLIFLCARQRADKNCSRRANGHSKEDSESQVIYSVPHVGRYQQHSVITSDTECVYSLIKV